MTKPRKLQLERPLVFIDIEATGISPPVDRIVELSLLKLKPEGDEEVMTFRANPGVRIPEDATAVHGIRIADVANQPPFQDFATDVGEFLRDSDLAGFNVARFDLPMLEAEMRRAGVELGRRGRSVVDVMAIYHTKERRDLPSAVRFYCKRTLEGAHSASVDARASLDVLRAQLRKYSDLPLKVDALHSVLNPGSSDWIDPEGRFVRSEGRATFNFGRHRGRALEEVAETEPSYLEWLIDQDFSSEVLDITRLALKGQFPTGAGGGPAVKVE